MWTGSLWDQVQELRNKIEKKTNEFLEEDPAVDVMLYAVREKESLGIKEVSPDLRDTSWCTARTRSG